METFLEHRINDDFETKQPSGVDPSDDFFDLIQEATELILTKTQESELFMDTGQHENEVFAPADPDKYPTTHYPTRFAKTRIEDTTGEGKDERIDKVQDVRDP